MHWPLRQVQEVVLTRPYEFDVKICVATTLNCAKGGQFVTHIPALPGKPHDGHTLETFVPDIWACIVVCAGSGPERALTHRRQFDRSAATLTPIFRFRRTIHCRVEEPALLETGRGDHRRCYRARK